ncbi:MAG: FAD-binding protein, partial [Clostridia bacterium]|nr:FAD-binding protein [Clostridia bacterium]
MNTPDALYHELDTSKISPLKAGGMLRKVVCPSSMAELKSLSGRFADEKQQYVIVGKMSNILVLDGGYDGIVISTEKLKGIDIRGNTICCGSGESLAKIAALAAEKQLSGLEKLSGIPGTVGGAVCMNGGCFGKEISELTRKVYVFDMDKQLPLEWTGQQMAFSYRSSDIMKGTYVII